MRSTSIRTVTCTWRRGLWLALAAFAFALCAPTVASAQGACPDGYGDLTLDGNRNVTDVQCAILSVLAELSGGPVPACAGAGFAAQDVNCDGSLSIPDVQLLISLVLGSTLSPAVDGNGDGCPDDCEMATSCSLAMPIACGDVINGDTTGALNTFESYNCQTWTESGPELVYEFTAPYSGQIDYAFSDGAEDLDVFVLDGTCASDQCIKGTNNGGSFTAVAGATYYIVVDGFLGDAGAFTLSVSCPLVDCGDGTCDPATEDCDNCASDCGCGAGEACDGGTCEPLGDCCSATAAPGCLNAACESCVCAGDAFCCNTSWDSACVSDANDPACAADCACAVDCGDGVCDPLIGEDCDTCAADCACDPGSVCSGGICETPGDCCTNTGVPGCTDATCEACVCALDSFCCSTGWDGLCVASAQDPAECFDDCGCVDPCGDGTCDAAGGEDCGTCAADCGCTGGDVCIGGACILDPCGDGTCDPNVGEDCGTCAADCACDTGDACSNGVCVTPTACDMANAMPIACGDTINGDTTTATNTIDGYNCQTWNETGPEDVYTFTAPFDGVVTFTFTDGAAEDLDVFILEPACDSESCILGANNGGTFTIAAGQTYYIVVDGFLGDFGAYTLALSCLDTSACGDGTCDPLAGEDCDTCAADCACTAGDTCVDGVCEPPGDCCSTSGAPGCTNAACETCVCDLDSFCCATGWDSLCVSRAQDPAQCFDDCGCVDPCGDGTCDAAGGEDCGTCAADCGCVTGDVCFDGACILDPCGDGTCDPLVGEDCDTCAADCACDAGDACNSGACVTPTACDMSNAMPIACGDVIDGDTTTATNTIDGYNCRTWDESGPEDVYTFTAPFTGQADFTFSDSATEDLDVFVLETTCDSESCIVGSNNNGTFDMVAGQTYYIVVDGFDGDFGAYTLGLTCTDPSLCGDGTCDPLNGEDCDTCAADCGCDAGEICDSGACVVDTCGDSLCDAAAGENCTTCSLDCGCGTDEVCESGICEPQGDCCENTNAPGCTNTVCEDCVCAADTFCCSTGWDSICVGAAQDPTECFDDCGCIEPCGDGTCDAAGGEDCGTCAADCGCDIGDICFEGACVLDECGDGTCDPLSGEDCDTCAADCACNSGDVCDDGACVGPVACDMSNAMPIACGDTINGDTTTAVNTMNGYNCQTWNESGPEDVYVFTAAFDGPVNWTFSDGPIDLDVFVLAPSCDDFSCIASANNNGSFNAVSGETYYIIVDGFNGALGPYTLGLSCGAPPAGDCCSSNGSPGCEIAACETCVCDGDPFCCDTSWDGTCADSAAIDCAADCGCTCGDGVCDAVGGEDCDSCALDCGCDTGDVCNAGVCETPVLEMCSAPIAELACGQLMAGDTSNSTNDITSYNCVSWNESGPDDVYTFVAPLSGEYDYSVSPAVSPDLDLFVLGPDCDAESCVDFTSGSGTFTAVAGETYYIVVDGFGGVSGAYDVLIECPVPCDPATACDGLECGSVDCDGTSVECGTCTEGTCVDNMCEFPDSCIGKCGTFVGGGECNCDSSCFTFGDCCGDICVECATEFALECACGDGICDAGIGEDCDSCESDCACGGNDICDAGTCVAEPTCDATGTIDCAAGITGTTVGAAAFINQYACTTWNEGGPEVAYTFTAGSAGPVTATLSNLNGVDLDVFVLEGECAPTACLAHGNTSATFTAVTGTTYYVVVDGFASAQGSFSLALSCGP